MKTCLQFLPFMVCLALAPARAADQASPPVDKNAIATDAVSDLPKSTDPLIDPLTGTPYIAVHNGDIVESAIFITEFQRAHPSEHAILMIGDIENDLSSKTFDPAAAFTWDGKVYIHSAVIGDVLIPDISPEHIEGYMSRLYKAHRHLIDYYYKQSFANRHLPFPSQDEEYRMGYADTMPRVIPNELPGDTDNIQAQRVKHRLIKLGLTNVKDYRNIFGKDKNGKPYICNAITFDFQSFAFLWESRGVRYTGLASKTYLPGMLDSIIFSIDYQKANPTEKVFCFLHVASDGHIASSTVYTKNGQLWFHHLAPGDLPSALSLDDLKDSDNVIHADLEVYRPALKKFDAEDAQLRHQPPSGLKRYLNGYKAPDLSVGGVLTELQKRGVEAKIIGEPDNPELLFVWGNKPFTYKPGLGCFAGKQLPTTAAN